MNELRPIVRAELKFVRVLGRGITDPPLIDALIKIIEMQDIINELRDSKKELTQTLQVKYCDLKTWQHLERDRK